MAAEWQAAILAAGAVASAGAGVWAARTRGANAQRIKRIVTHEQVHIPVLGQDGMKRLVRQLPSIGGAVGLYLLSSMLAPGAHYLALTVSLSGFLIPSWFLEWRETRRLVKLADQLSKVMGMVSTALRRGDPLEVALREASHFTDPPLGPILARIAEAPSLGINLSQAVEMVRGASQVNDSTDFQVFATEMVICHERGANVITAFDALRQVLAARRKYRDQVREQMSQHFMQSLVIACIGFAVLLFYGGTTEDGLKPLLESATGQMVLGASIVGNLFMIRWAHMSQMRQSRKL